MGVNRTNIITQANSIISEITDFKKIYTAQTSLSKEHSFPICWVLLGDETFSPATLKQDYRNIELIFRIATKQSQGEDNLNPLIDKVVEKVSSNFTLNGSIIKLEIVNIETDDGLLYPYSVADIVCECMVR